MATALQSAIERISENHECSICRRILREPKLLHCAHTFCKSCLQQCYNWGNNGALNSKMLCPVCRQETVLPRSGVEGLKTNFELQSLLEEISQLEIPTSNISWQEGVKPSTCKTHKGEMLKLYCETCQTLACDICAGADHSDTEHVMIDTDTASKKYRESLKGLFPAFGQDIKCMKANIRRCATIDKEYLNKIAEIRKVVQDKASEAIAKLRSEETRLLDEIKSHEEDHTERMHEQKRALKRLLTRKQRSLKLAKDFAREAGDEEYLSFYPASCKGMKKLQDEHLQKPMGLHSVPVLLGSQGIATGANLGNVVVKDVWELHRELGKKGNGEREFQSARGIAAASTPDLIAVADWNNSRVVVCDHQGNYTTIPVKAKDVAASNYRQWLVAEQRCVKVYAWENSSGMPDFEFKTIPEGDDGEADVTLASIAVMPNGNIFVGDVGRNVLTEHRPVDGSPCYLLLRTIPVDIHPYFLAALSNALIAISETERGQVRIVNADDCKVRFVVKPTVHSRPVKCCMGVCTNDSGIYIAVSTYVKSGHIHHYDCKGQFVSCVAQGLYNPKGITFTGNGQQLAVADLHSVKVYYKL